MKAIILVLMLISAATDLCAADEKPSKSNAYRMEMLGVDGKTVAIAIIWTPDFEFKMSPNYRAKCKLRILQTKSKEDAVVTFNGIIQEPDELVDVEVQSFPKRSIGTPPEKTPIVQCVNFNPGAHDLNVKLTIERSKDGFDALWYCDLSSGRKIGGDVKITRVFAEQNGAGQPAAGPASKSEVNPEAKPEAEVRPR